MMLNISSSLQDAELAKIKKEFVTLKLDYADLFKGGHLVVCITFDWLSLRFVPDMMACGPQITARKP
jgi:hypothetical protein